MTARDLHCECGAPVQSVNGTLRFLAPASPSAAPAVLPAINVERLGPLVHYEFCRGMQHDYGYGDQRAMERIAKRYVEQGDAGEQPDPILTYTDPAGGPDWEPRRDEA